MTQTIQRRRRGEVDPLTVMLDTMAVYAIEPGIRVRDINESLRFWRDTLGLKPCAEIFVPGGVHVWALRFGNSMIKLLAGDPSIAASAPGDRGSQPGSAKDGGGHYFTLHVLNAEEMAQKCEDAGFTVVAPFSHFTPERDSDPECNYAIVLDPDGNRVEFSQGSPWVPPTEEFQRGEV